MFLIENYRRIYYKSMKIIFKLIYGNKIYWGKHITFRKGFTIEIVEKGKLKIGDNCFFNKNCSINCLGRIEIGSHCLFGENVKIYDHNHVFTNKRMKIVNQGFKIGSIKIGNNCWIGSNVTILKDIIIGNNVVIGANCLIYKSIPDNSIVKNNSQLIIEQRD